MRDGNTDEANVCGICAEARRDWAVGMCPHRVCSDCSHRMRVLYGQKTCAFCKVLLNTVLVTSCQDANAGFERIRERTAKWLVDNTSAMEFETRTQMQKVTRLRRPCCPACKEQLRSVAEVREHVKTVHRRVLCEICVDHRKVFLGEQVLYSENQPPGKGTNSSKTKFLRQHLKDDHPYCDFCRKHFYDDVALFDHLTKQHFLCSVCDGQGRSNQYFRDYGSLERHYRKEHFMCDEPGCRGVVFPNAVDLKVHQHQMHSGQTARTDRARLLTINLAELHEAAVASNSSTRRARPNQQPPSSTEDEEYSIRRQNFASSNVVFNTDRTDGSSSAGDGRAVRDTSEHRTRRFAAKEPPDNPDSLRERNAQLVALLKQKLDPVGLERFQDASGDFRNGNMSSKSFFDVVVENFGSGGALEILPELIALLPEVHLRASLTDIAVQVYGVQDNVSRTTTSIAPWNGDEQTGSAPGEFPVLGQTGASRPLVGAWTGSSSSSTTRENEFPSLGGQPAESKPKQRSRATWTGPSTESQGAAAAVQPPTPVDSFPSLGGVNADPNMRAGAVWGGAARQAYQAPKSKRSDPSPVADAFPSLPSSKTTQHSSTSSSTSEKKAVLMPTPGKSRVLDVTSVRQQRQQRINSSAVPKMGSNGLPWEKKKNKANLAAAKSALEGRDSKT